MPFVNNAGIKIHYETIGDGVPIVFHHSNGGCLRDWHDLGYVDALKNDYQLILIDARGYGESDKPYDPNLYSIEHRVADTLAVMDALAIKKANCFGYSMGGRTAFALMKYQPQRFGSFIIGGTHPYGASRLLSALQSQLACGIAHVVKQAEKAFGVFPAKVKESYLKNDVQAMLAASTLAWPNTADCLESITVPCLLFAGGKDPITMQLKQCAQQLKNSQLHIFDDLNHLQVYWQSELIVPFLRQILPSWQ